MKYLLSLMLFACIGVLFGRSGNQAASSGASTATTVRLSLVNSNLSSATLLNGLDDHCTGVTLTLDATKADYVLEAQQQSSIERGNYGFTLFSKNGDAVFHSVTVKPGNAFKDLCDFATKVR